MYTYTTMQSINLTLHIKPFVKKFIENLKNMLGQAIERKPKVEQVNATGGRLLREAKVRSIIIARWHFFPSLSLLLLSL